MVAKPRSKKLAALGAMILATGSGSAQDSVGEVRFRGHAVNPESTFSACAVIDVNRDGRLDIVCGGWWYEAPGPGGSGAWEKHFVREVEMIRGRYDGYSHLPYDVNGDGWTDVINVNYRSQSMFWVQHPGEELASGEPWEKHTIAIPGSMETGRLVDVDGDGRLDILPNGVKFASWWELTKVAGDDGIARRRWVRHDLPGEVAGHGVGFGDVNGDGRGDVVGPRGWLEAPEDPRRGEWTWHAEFDLGPDASIPILVADVDGDGDNDLICGRGHNYGVFCMEQIVVTESKEAGPARSWRRHWVDETWSQAHALLWADVNNDGREDLITGKRYMAHDGKDPGAYDPLVIYWYERGETAGSWTRHTIASGERVGFGLDPKAVDLDADGDLDLVVSGRSGLYWLENLLDPGGATTSARAP